MKDERNWLPPLLRGIGTSLILVTSLLVTIVERQEQARQATHAAELLQLIKASDAAAGTPDGPLSVAREVRLLRLQLMQQDDLADQVFENPWFQVLGLLGTMLIAASFLVEAWQRRSRRTDPALD